MTNLEQRLQDAYDEAARTVRPEEIRSLHAHIEQPARRRPRIGQRPGRSLAPLLAAAAVVAVAVTTAIVVPQALTGRHDSQHAAAKGRSKAAAHGAASASLPAFAVTENGSGLAILDTATWKTIAHVPAPSGQAFTAVAGAADDRTFVVAADLNPQTTCDTWLYQLHLNSTGRQAGLNLLVPRMTGLPTAVAVSANAGTVGYSVVHCASGPAGHISGSQPIGNVGVINLATKQVKQWSFTLDEDYTNDLSLSADGSLLGFSSYLDGTAANPVDVGRVLPTSAAPGLVRQRDHIVVRPEQGTYAGADAVALSTDGRAMYACTQSGSPATLAAYDTTTGQLTRVLRSGHPQGLSCAVTADPSGGYLLVSGSSKSGRAGKDTAPSSDSSAGLPILRSARPPTMVLSWVDLATGSFTTLPVKLPIGSGVAI